MNKIEEELDKKKSNFVRYSFTINAIVVIAIFIILALFEIEKESVLSIIWKYYFR